MSGRDAWYREWFGEEYLALYPHRDEAEAERAVDLFRSLSGPPSGSRVLDLACGGGRHLPPLRAAGYRPAGLDLSRPLLGRARRRTGGRVPLVRADMRAVPFGDGAFQGVVQFFTSFGYFENRADDEAVLGEIRRVLRPGGRFLLDFLNADHVRRTLVPEDERTIDGHHVRQRRWIEGGRVRKRIEIQPAPDAGGGATGEDIDRTTRRTRAGDGGPAVFHEDVRLYEPEELEALLAGVGLVVEDRRGDYAGSEFSTDAPRLVLLGSPA